MRIALLLIVLFGSVPVMLAYPYYGVLLWYWVSYMNPHRFTWGAYYYLPAAEIVAIPTLIGLIFGRKMKNLLTARETILLIAVWAWFIFTYLVATQQPRFVGHMNAAEMELLRVSKNILMVFVMILLVTSFQKLRYLMLVTAMSLGVLSLKAVAYGAQTQGTERVWGPPDSFLADNNGFGLALNMALPMLFFLAREEKNKLLRRVLQVMFVTSILAVVLTYSRGGLLGLEVVLALICVKARRKAVGAVLLFAAVAGVVAIAPEQWMSRMDTFMQGKLDDSAKQRIVAWGTAWNLVQDYPLTGAGFNALPDVNLFSHYQNEALPGGFKSTGPHSIYFQLMADHGFIGLFLFLGMIASAIATLRNTRKRANAIRGPSWVTNYTHMIETSLIGFLVSGAFLGLSYFDLFYQVIGLSICIRLLFRKELAVPAVTQERAAPTEVEAQEPVEAYS